jgi:hypothetical protein
MSERSFSLDRSVVFDVEVVPNRWLVGFYGRDRRGDLAFVQVENAASLRKTLDAVRDAGKTLVGYNSTGYDLAVVKTILDGHDPFARSQAIINSSGRRAAPDLGIDHVDLAARVTRAGRFPGLKTIAANLGLPIDELPSAWFAEDADDERWSRIREYNRRDLLSTYEILRRFAPELCALARLSNELGDDLRSIPSPQVVERFFVESYKAANGAEPKSIETPSSVRYRAPKSVKRPKTEAAREWFEKITTEPLRIAERESGAITWHNPPKATFDLGRLSVTVGIGGLHSKDEPRLYRATKRRRLIMADVSSYYPSMIAAYGFTPSSTGDSGREAYRSILERRLSVKKAASVEADPVKKAELDAEERGLKLLLNATFGKLGDRFSTLFDPAAMVAVTLTGQALLVNLIEELHAVGARVVSANTDGIVLSVDRENDRYRGVLGRWQRRTGLRLDITPLRRFVALATNNAAYLTTRGKVKSIGKLKTDLRPIASPNGLAIAESVVKAALFDKPVEETLDSIVDPIRFAFVSRKTKRTKRAVLIAGDAETELGKVSRWYRAKFGENEPKPRIVHESESGRKATPAKAQDVRLMLDVPETAPADLDRAFYVREARRLFQRIDGLPKSRRLVESSPLAAEVFDRGLWPCPMWLKTSFTGREANRPSLLWPWRRASTIGAYTGPETGVLIVDIDEPMLWRAAITEAGLWNERLDDLASTMVSARVDDPASVRAGRGRGKLIFRLDDHAGLDRIKPTTLHKSLGVDLFFGEGIPAVLGAGKDGSRYVLDGELGDAPAWLIELLAKRLAKRPRGVARSKPQNATPLLDFDAEHALDDRFETLKTTLSTIEPKLGGVSWSEKTVGQGRTILVGRCPFEHESKTSSPTDLSAGIGESGEFWVWCEHSSCDRVRLEVKSELQRLAFGSLIDEFVPIKPLEPAKAAGVVKPEPVKVAPKVIEPRPESVEIVESVRESKIASAVLSAHSGFTLHVAGCGTGKTHGSALAAVERARQGLPTLLVVPTLEAARNVFAEIKAHDPELARVEGLIAKLYGQDRGDELVPTEADAPDELEAEPGPLESYPMKDETLIAISTHAQLVRRGFSKFIRGIYQAIGPKTIETVSGSTYERPAFAILIDELHSFLDSCRFELKLSHRFKTRAAQDGRGGTRATLGMCPVSSQSGNCGNCDLATIGAERLFNTFSIPELRPLKSVRFDEQGKPLSKPGHPVELTIDDFTVGEWRRVGATLFASRVEAFRGTPVDSLTRYNAPMLTYSSDPKTNRSPVERNDEIVAHVLEYAFRPVVMYETPVDKDSGSPVDPAALREKIAAKALKLEHYVWPVDPCEVVTLRAIDLIAFERLRRFAEAHGVSIQGFTATATDELIDVLSEVFGDKVERIDHESPVRKIERLAIASIEGYTTTGALSVKTDSGRVLVTKPLEEFSRVAIFAAVKTHAVRLYRYVEGHHPGVRLIANRTAISTDLSATRVAGAFRDDGEARALIHYARGPLATGANLLNLRTLVVDCAAFRRIATFTPESVEIESFMKSQAKDRAAIVAQNVGRLLRGESGKVALLILLNAEAELVEALARDKFIRESVENVPIITPRYESLTPLVRDAYRWHGQNGVEPWRCSEEQRESRESQRKASLVAERSKSRQVDRDAKRETKRDRLRNQAIDASDRGVTWKIFSRKTNVNRYFDDSEIDEIKSLFGR